MDGMGYYWYFVANPATKADLLTAVVMLIVIVLIVVVKDYKEQRNGQK
ncbi:hypothetical protein [Pectinatus frisingensis]|nr:hypothetical protein [Pectinatus frisingensis]